MRHGATQFAVFEPAFRSPKYEYKDDDAQDIPLPGVSGVIPKKELSESAQQNVFSISDLLGKNLATTRPTRKVF